MNILYNDVFLAVFLFSFFLFVIIISHWLINLVSSKLSSKKTSSLVQDVIERNVKKPSQKDTQVVLEKSTSALISIQKQKNNKILAISMLTLGFISLIFNPTSFVFLSAILAYAIAALILHLYYLNVTSKRKKKFIADLPDALDLMSRSITSGHSITNSINIVAENSSGIMADEFNSIKNNISIGATLQQALEYSAKQVKTSEFYFFTVITYVQQQTGGNIAILLNELAASLRQKISTEKKIQALASEPIASSFIIGTIPFVIISIITLLNPQYMSPLIYNSAGHTIILMCILAQTLGVLMMRKIIRIEI